MAASVKQIEELLSHTRELESIHALFQLGLNVDPETVDPVVEQQFRKISDLVSKTKRKKRNRTPGRNCAPLTDKQLEAVRLFGELEGNMTLVGKRMGMSRQSAKQHYDEAQKKLGNKLTGKAKTQRLRSTKRGQIDLANSDDKRR